jgi:predicted nuclease of predicted toxin-antitoxin system
MDEVDFINMTKDMDLADNAKIYEEYAYHIINETMANVKDNNEFQQCIVTLLECYSDLEKNRLYSKVVDTLENNDIKSFEKIKKDTVKIVPKED